LIGKRKAIIDFLAEADLDTDNELMIRREIGVNGKSRAFVNDTPVNLDQLRMLSSMLVDLHRQFDTLALGQSDFQRSVLDALAGHAALLEQYREYYALWQKAKEESDRLKLQKEQFAREYDYNKFLFEELSEASFRANELEEADSELKRMGHSEDIKAALENVVHTLGEKEQPLVQQIKSLSGSLQPFLSFHPQLPSLSDRLQSIYIELKDILSEASHISDSVHFDPSRMEQLNERVALGYKLLKKHGLKTTTELLDLQQRLEEKLTAVLDLDEQIALKEKETQQLQEKLQQNAQVLTNNRMEQVKPLQTSVNKLLAKVGMPNARLEVHVSKQELGGYGQDRIEFMFDANKSGRFEPIHRVASGGELSRLMLCIKSLVAKSLDLPTLIFDEIDTGISGEAARQVGMILKDLSKQRQIVCITHQPQIAGKAAAHFFVYKEIKGNAIQTTVRELSMDERITAIAQMLSGEKPTAAALENAREMVSN
jgi:DNA repair protein RecN (Recombination protein N)